MSFAVIGINHKTASISLREKLAFSSNDYDHVLNHLFHYPFVSGCFIVSTCNRSEVYISFDPTHSQHIQQNMIEWLTHYHQIDADFIAPHLYWYHDNEAITHLMQVASGLDSMILGEPQILGQVKKAFADAQRNKTVNNELNRLVQKVFSVAKRIRTETKIGSSTVSVAYAACLLAKQLFISYHDVTVMLIGAGETIELVARYLNQHQFKKIIVANRTKEKAQIITRHIEAETISLPEITDRLKDVDIVISSTASPLPIIGKGMVERSLQNRQHQKMLFVDLAVPRDVEPEVKNLPSVYLYTVDDLQGIIRDNLMQRKIAAQEANYIIQQECMQFMLWLEQKKSIDIVRKYRKDANRIKFDLESEALHAIKQGTAIDVVIHRLAYRLTNRLIHTPTLMIKEIGVNDLYLDKIKKNYKLNN